MAIPYAALGGAAGAGLGGALGRLGSLLEPLDYPRQALANLVAGPYQALQTGDMSHLASALPGLIGAAAGVTAGSTGVGLPLAGLIASLAGGAAQGLGKLSGNEAFNAPSPGDLADAISGMTEEENPGVHNALATALGVATDPLTWAGGLGGARVGEGVGTLAGRAGKLAELAEQEGLLQRARSAAVRGMTEQGVGEDALAVADAARRRGKLSEILNAGLGTSYQPSVLNALPDVTEPGAVAGHTYNRVAPEVAGAFDASGAGYSLPGGRAYSYDASARPAFAAGRGGKMFPTDEIANVPASYEQTLTGGSAPSLADLLGALATPDRLPEAPPALSQVLGPDATQSLRGIDLERALPGAPVGFGPGSRTPGLIPGDKLGSVLDRPLPDALGMANSQLADVRRQALGVRQATADLPLLERLLLRTGLFGPR